MQRKAFMGLKLEVMRDFLFEACPEWRTGNSRATKAVVVAKFEEVFGPLNDEAEAAAKEAAMAATVAKLVAAGELPPSRADEDQWAHDNPEAAARLYGTTAAEEMERVNPPLPISPSVARGPEFVFKDTGLQDRSMSAIQAHVWGQLMKAFEAFSKDPFSTHQRRLAIQALYSLKTLGVIANPDYRRFIDGGAAWARAKKKELRLPQAEAQ